MKRLAHRILLGGALFSWVMVFLSWRFAYPLEIIADWALLSLVLSAFYGIVLYRRKAMRFIKDPESMK